MSSLAVLCLGLAASCILRLLCCDLAGSSLGKAADPQEKAALSRYKGNASSYTL